MTSEQPNTSGGMSETRYSLLNQGHSALTKEEMEDGWHFCAEWDDLLIHPNDNKEYYLCRCVGYEKFVDKIKEENKLNQQKKGWKSGSAEEFLTDTDSASFQSHCHSCGVPWASHMGIAGTCAEIVKLRRERDEARREVCEMNSIEASNESVDFLSLTPQDIANERGWDCYSSDTLSQEVSQEVSQGVEQAKEGKFSKNPPKIKLTKKKKK